jgi:D-alanine--poly(phosphoribitol) ligase subunit 1
MTELYETNLYSRFHRLALTTPHAPALTYSNGNVVSYQELDLIAVTATAVLQEFGIARSSVAAIFHDKTPQAYGVMLACLRIGAIYVNLDENNPPERLARILETCRPARIFCGDAVSNVAETACQSAGHELVRLSLPDKENAANTVVGDSSCVIGSDIAYIMFTSGSTGNPKGVAISHSQVLNFIDWAATEFSVGPGDTLTNANPMYFDNSVFDFYASLFNGAALAPLPAQVLQDPRHLVDAVAAAGCTLWFSVPSLLIYLTTTRVLQADSWPAMRTIVFGGEGYPLPELRKLFDFFGTRVRLVNVYGPTECTCICSAHEITPADLGKETGLPPIGHLAPNFRGHLLDGDLEVNPGESGELCLVGPNVGLGYFRDRERKAEAFVSNPLCDTHGERMYRTGDLMRIDPADGLLYFVGRKDQQFKHMGYRIEAGEIEAALNRLEGVEPSVVVYKRQRQSFGEIVAFVATRDKRWSEDAVKEALRQHLPGYMIPQRVELRASLPHNANGKIDRKKLFEEA